jgi:hypothetical protein
MHKVISSRLAFLLSVSIGSASLLAGGYLDRRPIAIGISLAVMLLYGLWVSSSIKSGGYVDELADSFYYLGFMLTLTALISSIPGFINRSGLENVESIVQMFGLGLSTTIVGLGGKLLFSQFKNAGPRTVEEAQAILIRNISDLAFQVHETSRSIANSRENAAGQFQEIVRSITQNFMAAIEQLSSGLSESVNTLLKTTTKLVEEHHSHMAQNQANLSAGVSQVKQETDLLKEVVKQASSSTKKQVDALKKTGEEFARAIEHFKQAATSGQEFSDQLSKSENQLSDFAQRCTLVSSELNTLANRLQSQGRSADDLVNHVREDLAFVETYKKSIRIEVEEAKALIDQVHQNLLKSSEFIIRKLTPG